ncbi:16S rRNA (uracil(1498)-N(3))-methyltransferase [Psychrobacter sp. I-STPA10]|uniref:16S rRNA (uracil(1498)-N(3))-methyltransferase n=1 Tax=Psychrobacter sp. I-STPA10 TaxID=2585769 RepID=UPI001E473438|nr:16S rRNA (uracil(1498)-N(3))-methyltransferase [Psychrobacter sp. I-STPA10]
MRRFFYLPSYSNSSTNASTSHLQHAFNNDALITLTEDIFHHWCRVLRAKEGDKAIFFDGHGGEYTVQLQQIEKKSATAKIIDCKHIDHTNPYYTHIALVMSRGDRMDYALQKATEMGVSSIQLLTSQHGEVFLKPNQVDKKMAHWQQVMLSACEQCGLNRPPLLLKPVALNDWLAGEVGEISDTLLPLANIDYYQKLQASHKAMSLWDESHSNDIETSKPLRLVLAVPNEPTSSTTDSDASTTHANAHTKLPASQLRTTVNTTEKIKHYIQNSPNCAFFTLLIGAEGGLSDAELSQAIAKQFIPWQIGNRILRTETAPVVALATLQVLASMAKTDM